MRSYPEFYETLRYDCACFKEIHNTYDGKGRWGRTLVRLGESTGAPPRGIELDLHQCAHEPYDWCVKDLGNYDNKPQKCLRRYFRKLRKWTDKHPEHDPIHVVLDLKTSRGDGELLARELDPYILESFRREQLYAPGDLLARGEGSLRDVATTHGWPTIPELFGRLIFTMSGDHDGTKKQYAAYQPAERLCFVDQAFYTNTPTQGGPSQIVVNCEFFNSQIVGAALDWVVHRPGLLTRGYYANSPGLWASARQVAINMIALQDVNDSQSVSDLDLPFGFVVREELPEGRGGGVVA
jgi:hypothetical protein